MRPSELSNHRAQAPQFCRTPSLSYMPHFMQGERCQSGQKLYRRGKNICASSQSKRKMKHTTMNLLCAIPPHPPFRNTMTWFRKLRQNCLHVAKIPWVRIPPLSLKDPLQDASELQIKGGKVYGERRRRGEGGEEKRERSICRQNLERKHTRDKKKHQLRWGALKYAKRQQGLLFQRDLEKLNQRAFGNGEGEEWMP